MYIRGNTFALLDEKAKIQGPHSCDCEVKVSFEFSRFSNFCFWKFGLQLLGSTMDKISNFAVTGRPQAILTFWCELHLLLKSGCLRVEVDDLETVLLCNLASSLGHL